MIGKRALAYFALLLAVFIWGVNFLVVKDGIAAWDKQQFSFLAARFWLACIVYALVLLIRYKSPTRAFGLSNFRLVLAAALVGLVLALGYGLQTAYLARKGPVSAAFLTSTTVLWTSIIARFFGKPLYPATKIGVLLAGVGLLLMHWTQLPPQFHSIDLLALGAAIAFAVEILLVSKFAPQDQSMQWTLISCIAVAILMTSFALPEIGSARNENWHVFSAGKIFAVVFTGIVATFFALFFQNWAQAQKDDEGENIIDGPRVAIISSLEPVFTTIALISLVLLGTRTTNDTSYQEIRPFPLLGCSLILIGTLVSEFAAAKRSQRNL
jgi:drug/metabolite transporter (DMT)-like permease